MKCLLCKKDLREISEFLGVCVHCIRGDFKRTFPYIEKAHRASRAQFHLPAEPPRAKGGLECNICANGCAIPKGGEGFCGIRKNQSGRFNGTAEGNLEWYYDFLPTNCVGDWVCPGGSRAGYPKFSYRKGPEYGYKNLAVFYNGCSFNCLFCQNWHFRQSLRQKKRVKASELARCVDEATACICYFGGDPTPQLPHAIEASKLALENNRSKILRLCWETNGSMNPLLLDEMAELSMKSGGCIKFDLKAWDEGLNKALCGVSNKRTLENFVRLSKRIRQRPELPFLVASTLLVPGYIDEEEVAHIANFLARLDPNIPYALLAFYPHFYMRDLPATSRRQAFGCKEAAAKEGLKNVRIGNIHLLR